MSVQVADVLMGNYGVRTIELVRGEGMYLYAADGTEYLDFIAGIAVCSLGHCHPVVTEAISQQSRQLLHCSNLFSIPQQRTLATQLTALSGLDQAFFCNSGTEANEAAIKLARKYAASRGETERTEIVSLPGGFHGRTLGALSITAKPAYQNGYHPLLPGCTTPGTLDAVVGAITSKTAACFVEVIQGEGGVRQVPTDVLLAIQARCREAGALLVVDEVQTGVGRTGTFFAHEQVGLKPDIITMAKGLGGGIPVGAVVARAQVAAAFTAGTHGTTFGGNPFATAVASAVVSTISDHAFLERVRKVGDHLGQVVKALGDDASGRGLMWGMTVGNAKEYVAQAAQLGVLLTTAGETRVRFVPPLIVDHLHIDELERRLKSLSR